MQALQRLDTAHQVVGKQLEEKEQELYPVEYSISCWREEDIFANHKHFWFIFTPC